ncbi:hypothetical protein [Dehalobacter sp. TBBPA1]|uniref:hypothetical protein n=1 Tax=Dehalobacter sp. TBBPA1 TaxID=3235037 RepID=UPI0034A41D3B
MEKKVQEYCIECGEVTEFLYDGEEWLCKNCGSHNSQGVMNDSIPLNNDDEQDRA